MALHLKPVRRRTDQNPIKKRPGKDNPPRFPEGLHVSKSRFR